MRKLHVILLALVLFIGSASAHQDRILTILPDGSIPEIPATFGRVSLHISDLGSPTPRVQFRSGGYINDLPDCATALIGMTHPKEVFISGSWDHSEKIVPHYVDVSFQHGGQAKNESNKSGLNVIFNLRTAELIEMRRFSDEIQENGMHHVAVNLPDGCSPRRRAA